MTNQHDINANLLKDLIPLLLTESHIIEKEIDNTIEEKKTYKNSKNESDDYNNDDESNDDVEESLFNQNDLVDNFECRAIFINAHWAEMTHKYMLFEFVDLKTREKYEICCEPDDFLLTIDDSCSFTNEDKLSKF